MTVVGALGKVEQVVSGVSRQQTMSERVADLDGPGVLAPQSHPDVYEPRRQRPPARAHGARARHSVALALLSHTPRHRLRTTQHLYTLSIYSLHINEIISGLP